jgi:hypothetical protein
VTYVVVVDSSPDDHDDVCHDDINDLLNDHRPRSLQHHRIGQRLGRHHFSLRYLVGELRGIEDLHHNPLLGLSHCQCFGGWNVGRGGKQIYFQQCNSQSQHYGYLPEDMNCGHISQRNRGREFKSQDLTPGSQAQCGQAIEHRLVCGSVELKSDDVPV